MSGCSLWIEFKEWHMKHTNLILNWAIEIMNLWDYMGFEVSSWNCMLTMYNVYFSIRTTNNSCKVLERKEKSTAYSMQWLEPEDCTQFASSLASKCMGWNWELPPPRGLSLSQFQPNSLYQSSRPAGLSTASLGKMAANGWKLILQVDLILVPIGIEYQQ